MSKMICIASPCPVRPRGPGTMLGHEASKLLKQSRNRRASARKGRKIRFPLPPLNIIRAKRVLAPESCVLLRASFKKTFRPTFKWIGCFCCAGQKNCIPARASSKKNSGPNMSNWIVLLCRAKNRIPCRPSRKETGSSRFVFLFLPSKSCKRQLKNTLVT